MVLLQEAVAHCYWSEDVRISQRTQWLIGGAIFFFIVFAPYQYYRYMREHSKRFRTIEEGRVYRSGCLTADGFREHITKHKIKSVITLWDEDPDPNLPNDRFSFNTIKESELCKELGVNYKFIFVKLNHNDQDPAYPPQAGTEFLAVLDKEESYPVLFHCKAGLHRTGVMGAIFRMEYHGWSREDAMRELRSHGFGEFTGNFKNPYIRQYVLPYQPRNANGEPPMVRATMTNRSK